MPIISPETHDSAQATGTYESFYYDGVSNGIAQ